MTRVFQLLKVVQNRERKVKEDVLRVGGSRTVTKAIEESVMSLTVGMRLPEYLEVGHGELKRKRP